MLASTFLSETLVATESALVGVYVDFLNVGGDQYFSDFVICI